MRSFAFAALVLSSAVGCSAYDPDLGGVPYRCAADEPRCPDGYSCQDPGNGTMVCISDSGPGPDAMMPPGFLCDDDSLLEGPGKNDTTSTAYATNVATQRKTISFADLAVCPEGDKDTYLVTTTLANQNLEAVTMWESGNPVSVSILNAGGTSINNGVANGEMSVRAYAANLPVGSYYVQIYAAATTKNNYRMSITVDP